ncbi:MAG: hypothetical protein BYD32DRAFT_423182 [Podila humilis]|nr:MAG: hypothetical protein BYD32DRAFT_423182 [Podila humilis]
MFLDRQTLPLSLYTFTRDSFLLGNSSSSRITLFCRYTIATLITNILNSPTSSSAW